MNRQRAMNERTVGRSWRRGAALSAGLALGSGLAVFPSDAYAYFDPNAGSMLFQLLSPVIFIAASVMLAVRGGIRSALGAVRSVFKGNRTGSADVQPEK
jgi:hypothetical protein